MPIIFYNSALANIDTMDATATHSDIILGKTAYVNGRKITGTAYEKILKQVSETKYIDGYGTGVNIAVNIPAGYVPVSAYDTSDEADYDMRIELRAFNAKTRQAICVPTNNKQFNWTYTIIVNCLKLP